MDKNVEWVDVYVDDQYLTANITTFPPVISKLVLNNVRFATTKNVRDLITSLRGRKVAQIYIENCSIPKTMLITIAMLTSQMGTQTLSFRCMNIDDQVCEYIAHFCTGTVTSLDVAYNPITYKGLFHIFTMKLSYLDLSGIPLETLQECKQPAWDKLFECTKSLTAKRCFISCPPSFAKMCDTFRDKTWRIDMLDFSYNNLRAYDAVRFLASSKSCSIDLLNLGYNELDDRVLSALPGIRSISYIFFDANHLITDKGVISMLQAYANNPRIKHLSLVNCGLSIETLVKVCAANDEHRRNITETRAELMELIGVPDIVEDAIALL